MKTIIMKMTDAYDYQDFYEKSTELTILDCRGIEGTRCYLDDIAKKQLLNVIAPFDYRGIHFIDSGNYHYLSYLWISKIDVDFNLVLFDHHPDDQPPSFGDITSCGGWVLESREKLSHLKNVFTFGVGDVVSPNLIPNDLPLYISIDKDVLSTDYAMTDWDQGDMTLEELFSILENTYLCHTVLGVDISGDSGEFAESGATLNNQTNATIFDFLSIKS